MTDLLLIGCTKSKRTERCAARDMYDPSDLFRRRRAYAEASGLPWGILSAGAGVLRPDQSISPYDLTIEQRMRPDMDPRGWAIGSIQSAVRLVVGQDGPWPDELTIEVHAGVDYLRTLELARPAFAMPFELVHPVRGLGIGQQKAWYGVAMPDADQQRLFR